MLPNKKKILFPSSFWVYLIFLSFSIILEKDSYVTKEESSAANILVPSAWNIGMFREKRHIQEKDNWEKSSRGQRCQDAEEKCYRACV